MDGRRDPPPDPGVAATPPCRYTSPDEDSARWGGFPFRDGDIVISTRSRSGTTWTQMICALLVFQTPELPAPLGRLSPWLDWLVLPQADVYERLEAQTHRRFIKTHTPLDGVPLDERATYVVAARHPLDAAVSMYHHRDNINRDRMRELTGATAPSPAPPTPPTPRRPLHEWLVGYVDWDPEPREWLDSLPGTMLHLRDAWARRADPNVVLVHYDDLIDDLAGEMRRLSSLLGIPVDEARWPALVRAARFEAMRRQAATMSPDTPGVLKDRTAFFRHGVSGEGRAMLSGEEMARYRERVAALAPSDLLTWLHHDGEA